MKKKNEKKNMHNPIPNPIPNDITVNHSVARRRQLLFDDDAGAAVTADVGVTITAARMITAATTL